jgi:hypothetical protein
MGIATFVPLTFGRRGRWSPQQAKSGGETLNIRANPCNPNEADDGSRTRDLRLGKAIKGFTGVLAGRQVRSPMACGVSRFTVLFGCRVAQPLPPERYSRRGCIRLKMWSVSCSGMR